MAGAHFIKSWSSTQPTITLSSGEAELHGVVKAGAIGLGILSMLQVMGICLHLNIWTDSIASQGICGRQGLGKVRHLDTQDLWVQQRIRNNEFSLYKVAGEANPGDLFTEASLTHLRIKTLFQFLGCQYREGRPDLAPALRKRIEKPKALGGATAARHHAALEQVPCQICDLFVQPGRYHKRAARERAPHHFGTPCKNRSRAPPQRANNHEEEHLHPRSHARRLLRVRRARPFWPRLPRP